MHYNFSTVELFTLLYHALGQFTIAIKKFLIAIGQKTLSLIKLTCGVCSNRDNIFIQFCVLRTVENAAPYKFARYAAFAIGICEAFNMFSINIP